jgi:glyoxylase-like metal-dependent hydrolase (beta-lactamase superfamily II)
MAFDAGNDVKFRAVETLGHASHHLSFYETLGSGVFPGDAAGIYLNEMGLTVPTTPAPFRLDIALASLERLVGLKPTSLYYSHFGRATNAVEMLRAYAQQLRLWARIAKEGLDCKESLAEISKRIRREDPAICKAVKYIEDHAVLGETVLNESVRGIMSYVERSGKTGF